jgi:phage shock protein A
MRLFRRISDIISANLNEMVDRFEDPETMLKQAVREMDEAVAAALDGAVKAVANEKLLAKHLIDNRRHAERWRERAAKAVAAGDDDLARRAITRKIQYEKLTAALEDQHAAATETSGKLRRQIEGMQVKLSEAKRTLAALMARKRTADAQRRLLNVTSSGRCAAFGRFQQLVDRVELAEAESNAFCELVGTEDDDLFDDENEAVEQELAALKQSRGA